MITFEINNFFQYLYLNFSQYFSLLSYQRKYKDFYIVTLKDIDYDIISDCFIITHLRKLNKHIKNILIPDSFIINGKKELVKGIGVKCFVENKSVQNVHLPNTLILIANCAFQYCRDLESINLPDSLENIGENAFYDCRKLKLSSPYLPKNLKLIYAYSFYDTAIEEVVLPDNVSIIEDYAFAYCKSLYNITFGKNLKEIKDWAFYDCLKLTTLTFFENLQIIREYAFFDCCKLKNVSFHGKPNETTYVTILEDAFSTNSTISFTIYDDIVIPFNDSIFSNPPSFSFKKDISLSSYI